MAGPLIEPGSVLGAVRAGQCRGWIAESPGAGTRAGLKRPERFRPAESRLPDALAP